MLKKLKERWNRYWENEARKFDSALFGIVVTETRKNNKEFFEWYDKNKGGTIDETQSP